MCISSWGMRRDDDCSSAILGDWMLTRVSQSSLAYVGRLGMTTLNSWRLNGRSVSSQPSLFLRRFPTARTLHFLLTAWRELSLIDCPVRLYDLLFANFFIRPQHVVAPRPPLLSVIPPDPLSYPTNRLSSPSDDGRRTDGRWRPSKVTEHSPAIMDERGGSQDGTFLV